ncbi:MAG: hypothetical protein ABI615_06795 [Chthoniobacterales bacterium]
MNTEIPLPTNAESSEPRLSRILEDLLKRPNALFAAWQEGKSQGSIILLVVLGFLGLAAYGLIVGSFSGGVQWAAAPVKIAVGTLLSAVICFPSLYIFVCLSGGNAKLALVWGALAAMLCTTALLLVGFLPVAWIFSQSTTSLGFMGFLHFVIWIISLLIGFRILNYLGAALAIPSKGKLYAWAFIFLLVTLQMSTALRPILGESDKVLTHEKKFFLVHWSDVLAAPVKVK